MKINHFTLPENVRRWLDKAIPSNTPVPNKILNTQVGEMDIRGKWMPFTAQTATQAQPFSFVWQARFKVMPGVWIKAEDGHNSEKGWGGAKLWSIIPMGGRDSLEVFKMQLVRSLAELPWNPQFALAIPNLQWQDIDEKTFNVQLKLTDGAVSVSFELNEHDDVIRTFGKRYYDVPDGFVEADWHYIFSDHRDFEGVRIPASAVATYNKSEGSWEYWRGNIASVSNEA